MRQIGTCLREAREARGLSIADVYEITKIRPRVIEAMENGEFNVLPDGYGQAFIRTYAVGIRLDPKPLVARYQEWERRHMEEQGPEPLPMKSSTRMARHLFGTLNGTLEWLGL